MRKVHTAPLMTIKLIPKRMRKTKKKSHIKGALTRSGEVGIFAFLARLIGSLVEVATILLQLSRDILEMLRERVGAHFGPRGRRRGGFRLLSCPRSVGLSLARIFTSLVLEIGLREHVEVDPPPVGVLPQVEVSGHGEVVVWNEVDLEAGDQG